MIPLHSHTNLVPNQILEEFTSFRSRRPAKGMAGKITQIIMQDEDEYNFQLLMPLLAQLSRDDRWFAWIAPPLKLPKRWLLEAGIDINKIMMLQPRGSHDTLALARKALATGTCHAVISWPGQISQEQLQQLEQAAQTGSSHAIVIQPR
ncbi:MAG: cell division inhibitor SulA [Motiliproteus sp.]|jgi:cell division inhibitor SulA